LTASKPQSATLIDTLTEGYAAVNRRPLVLVLPVLLNLFLAFGTQVSFAPLVRSFSGLMQRLQPADADAAMTAELMGAIEALGQIDMRRQLAPLNFVPTLPLTQTVAPGAVEIGGFGGALLVFVLINIVALPLSALFLVLTAEAVQRGGHWRAGLLRAAGRAAVMILASVGVVAGVSLALGLPYLFLSGLLMLLSPPIGVLAVVILQLVSFWAWIYIGFANEAIVLDGQGPLQAIRASFNLVRHNFWSTLGFLGLSAFIIPLGLGVVWQTLSGSLVGLAAAALGSSYIGSGLAAARMVYYRERVRRAQGAPALASTGR
jgi:hypothetical protein